MLGIAITALAWSGCRAPLPTMVDRLREQVSRYPEMQTEDVYKFVHQAAFGNGHLMTDEAADRGYLTEEFGSVQADMHEPLLEALTPDGSIVRVNLRPFKAAGLNLEQLATGMIASAKEIQPNREAFERWWTDVIEASSQHTLPFDAAALQSFGSQRKAEGYPAVHHSATYMARYAPAYRVMLRDRVPK